MFDGILGRKSYSKCKSAIKLTKVRMEAIKKKRNAVMKYLRNDIADLLRNGLDINAYGRAEGLLVEMNMSSCYDLIEQFYSSISSQLSVMDKQKECPEECREAVASLMYAAARFADLPELRDLRNQFTQRYGNSLEAFVNKEFVEKLRSKPPTKDMKLQLLQDIAQDSSIEWNPKALEQKLYTPPPPEPEHPKKGSLKNSYDDGYEGHKSKDAVTPKNSYQDVGSKVTNAREYAASNRDEEDLPSHQRKEVAKDGYRLRISRVKEDIQSNERPAYNSGKDIREVNTDLDGQKKFLNSATDESLEEADIRKPFYSKFMPPPYVRAKATLLTDSDGNEMSTHKVRSSETAMQGVRDRTPVGDNNGGENHHQEDSVGEADKPKPRSVRKRNLKPPPGRDNAGSSASDATAKTNLRGMRQGDARRDLQTLSKDSDDQKDEEERLMDGLLLHYSKKPSPYETEKFKENLKPPPSSQTGANHGRAKSLPPEPTIETKARKGPPRASSFEPDILNSTGHVHPKLPDFEDLAARIAALSTR